MNSNSVVLEKQEIMTILQLCKKNPYPPNDGEAIAIYTTTKGLSEAGQEVTVLAMNTPKHSFDFKQLPTSVQQLAHFDAVFINTKIALHELVANLFTQQSYNIYRFASPKFKNRLIEYLQEKEYDIIQLEGVYLAPYIKTIRKYSRAKVVMRAHNVEFEIWERLAAEQKNPIKKWYMYLLAKRLKRFELRFLEKYDALVPISIKDAAQFKAYGYHNPLFTLPAHLSLADYPLQPTTNVIPSVCFIGSLDWMPNQKGLQWFLEEVWQQVLTVIPKATCFIAGRNVPTSFYHYASDTINIVGEVPNAIEFIQQHHVMIVPLFSGSGMRIKIIEGMAIGKPIVATTLAAEGIACTSGKNILLADEAATFAQAIIQCLQQPIFSQKLGQEARHFIRQHHDTTTLIEELLCFYQTLTAPAS